MLIPQPDKEFLSEFFEFIENSQLATEMKQEASTVTHLSTTVPDQHQMVNFPYLFSCCLKFMFYVGF